MDALTLFARTLMQRVEERQNTELSCIDLQPELMDRSSYLPSGEVRCECLPYNMIYCLH